MIESGLLNTRKLPAKLTPKIGEEKYVIDSVIKNNLWTNKIKDLSKDKILNGDGDDDKKIPDIMD